MSWFGWQRFCPFRSAVVTGEGDGFWGFAGCRSFETAEAAALCSLSCGRGFAVVAEKLVWVATVCPLPALPTGEGSVCWGFAGCGSFETAEAAALCSLSCGRGFVRGLLRLRKSWFVRQLFCPLPDPPSRGRGWFAE